MHHTLSRLQFFQFYTLLVHNAFHFRGIPAKCQCHNSGKERMDVISSEWNEATVWSGSTKHTITAVMDKLWDLQCIRTTSLPISCLPCNPSRDNLIYQVKNIRPLRIVGHNSATLRSLLGSYFIFQLNWRLDVLWLQQERAGNTLF